MHSVGLSHTMRTLWATSLSTLLIAAPVALGQPTDNSKGKLSRNFYRIPYADGEEVLMGANDYFHHKGQMDMFALSDFAYHVAAADGVVIAADDSLDDCGCTQDSSHAIAPCANKIKIRHAFGEVSSYGHLKQFSMADAFGVSDASEIVGMAVTQGQIIGVEGDVGRTCGNEKDGPRWGTCITEDEAEDLGDCGKHTHWWVRRESTDEFVQPMTYNIHWNVYVAGLIYEANQPDSFFCIQSAQSLPATTLNGFGNSHVYQNVDSITANSFEVKNLAAAVFHAANNIYLLPGFKAGAGNSYFRAEIGECNTTAP